MSTRRAWPNGAKSRLRETAGGLFGLPELCQDSKPQVLSASPFHLHSSIRIYRPPPPPPSWAPSQLLSPFLLPATELVSRGDALVHDQNNFPDFIVLRIPHFLVALYPFIHPLESIFGLPSYRLIRIAIIHW